MPTGPRKARPDDRLRIKPGIQGFPDVQLHIQGLVLAPSWNDCLGLLTWGMCMSRMSSHLFVRLRPPLRPDRGVCRMTRADQVKAGTLGPPRSGLALS